MCNALCIQRKTNVQKKAWTLLKLGDQLWGITLAWKQTTQQNKNQTTRIIVQNLNVLNWIFYHFPTFVKYSFKNPKYFNNIIRTSLQDLTTFNSSVKWRQINAKSAHGVRAVLKAQWRLIKPQLYQRSCGINSAACDLSKVCSFPLVEKRRCAI